MRRKALALIASLLFGSMLLTESCSVREFGSDVLSSFVGGSLANQVVPSG